VPAPRHRNALADLAMPRPPSFDEEDMSDKIPLMRRAARVVPAVAEMHWRGRVRSLLAVDDMVGRLVKELRDTDQLDNTIVVFTSDNGWLLGEHRITGQKYFGFEEAIRVPLLVRGPGFPRGRVLDDLVVNADLSPTFLRAAKAKAGRPQDGLPLQAITARPGSQRDRDLVIETGPNHLNFPYYAGLHTRRYQYEEVTTGDVELYDLERDPYELQNVADDPRYANVRAQLHERLERLRRCSGRSCHSAGGSPEPLP
jgi:arylsulfatase A-like enzyme